MLRELVAEWLERRYFERIRKPIAGTSARFCLGPKRRFGIAMEKVIMVTGGCGFIGSCFIRQTLAEIQDAAVVNLDKMTYAATRTSVPGDFGSRYRLIEGDIADTNLVTEILSKYRPSCVVNFAAESHVDRSIDHPSNFVMTNVVGTFQLLNAILEWWRGMNAGSQRQFRFLHVSTDEVYGSLGAEGLFSEDSQYRPNSPYSASKAASDHFVRAYHHTFGLPVLTTNCSNNYGPYQFPEKLIPLMILKSISGESLPVYGDGSNIRDWLYVEDHCHAIRRVLDAGQLGEVYNVGGRTQKNNLEVVEAICELVDEFSEPLPGHAARKSLIEFVTDRPGHDQRYAVDTSKIQSELGWEPKQSFESGLRQTVKWYLEHNAWIEEARASSYQGQRLGVRS